MEGFHNSTCGGEVERANHHILAREICDAAKEVASQLSEKHSLDQEEKTTLQMACSFLLLCLAEKALKESGDAAAAEGVLEPTRVLLAGRACGVLFPDADNTTAEYFLLLFESNFAICREEIAAGAQAGKQFEGESVLRSWLEGCTSSNGLARDAWQRLKGVWNERGLVGLVSSLSR